MTETTELTKKKIQIEEQLSKIKRAMAGNGWAVLTETQKNQVIDKEKKLQEELQAVTTAIELAESDRLAQLEEKKKLVTEEYNAFITKYGESGDTPPESEIQELVEKTKILGEGKQATVESIKEVLKNSIGVSIKELNTKVYEKLVEDGYSLPGSGRSKLYDICAANLKKHKTVEKAFSPALEKAEKKLSKHKKLAEVEVVKGKRQMTQEEVDEYLAGKMESAKKRKSINN